MIASGVVELKYYACFAKTEKVEKLKVPAIEMMIVEGEQKDVNE